MNNFKIQFTMVGTTVLTIISSFVGGFDSWLKLLMILMIGDFIFGWVNALKENKISSNKMFWGGVRKAMMMLMIGITYQMAQVFQIEELRNIIIAYYVLMEFVSIMEHSVNLDIPLPTFFKNMIYKFIEKLENYEGSNIEGK